ncbi:MAG: hypothetical protein H6721_09205 [Sandaracinus sp.]|nr:hypothetical protein [Sandaracinus sp.]MCB9621796.1 hypothetical protein [Sandaracinus sp.]MCB9632294.1 hypothetical protein [Sandaracinus sp.]
MTRPLLGAVWLGLVGLSVLGVSGARASAQTNEETATTRSEDVRSADRPSRDAPARPRAAVLVSSANRDTFFAAFTHELLANGLRERGYDVVPPQVAAAVLRVDGRDPEVCLGADACRDDVARTLGVGTVVIARLAIDASDARRARAELSFAHLGAPPVPVGTAEGDALSFGEALRERSRVLDVTQAPCAIRVRASLEVQALVDGETLASHVPPGAHEVEVRAAGRAPWRGTLVCSNGVPLEVRVR